MSDFAITSYHVFMMSISLHNRWISGYILQTLFLTFTNMFLLIKGDCFVNNMSYSNNSVWNLESCRVCKCEDQVAMCETVICFDPHCDPEKGEVLSLLDGQCCPVCSVIYRPCTYQGHQIPHSTFDVGSLILHNAEWSTEPCESCHCNDGTVECATIKCPALHCGEGELSQQETDECCPRCRASGRSCTYFGVSYAAGTQWNPTDCSKCVCHNGQTICYVKQCHPLVCQQGETLELLPTECCPQCVPPVCQYDSRIYQDGDVWKANRCSHCSCVKGEVHCQKQSCNSGHIKCAADEQLTWRRDKCCPECGPKHATCKDGGVIHYHGEMWNSSMCEYCACDNGVVHCSSVQCSGTRCAKDEELVMNPEECCHRCQAYSSCNVNRKMYKHGTSWQQSECDYCQCEDGQVVCYNMQCTACPTGTMRAQMAGECCGQCKPVQCAAQCSTCSPDNSLLCYSCSDVKMLLQDGRCVTKCSDGFFLNTQNFCQPCHHSCQSCREETQFHCTTCPAGRVWSHGQCLVECPPDQYEERATCVSCHSSCASCFGRRQSECDNCRLPWQLLQDNRCVDYCTDGRIAVDGVCQDCAGLCHVCRSEEDGTCKRCPPGMMLQQKRCVPTCDQRFFPQGNECKRCPSRCLICQDSTVCVQCNSRSYLVNASCVVKCPPGYSPNHFTRTCQVNNFPPRLLANNTIHAVTSVPCVITPSMLLVSDPDTELSQLKYHIIRPPTNGHLLRIADGHDEELGVSAVFTYAELSEGKIRFMHDRQAPLSGGDMEMWVSDGSRGGPRQSIPISVTSAQPPKLVKNVLLVVDKGASSEISTDKNLDIHDKDSAGSLLISVLREPKHGKLVESGADDMAIGAFPLDVLKSGQLMYKHDGSNGQHDHILFHASDGYNTLNILFNIEIRRKGSKEPQMVHNNDIYVEPGQMVQIIREDLEAETLTGRPSSDLIYTLTPPTNNPQEGDILMVVPIPEAGLTEGWSDIGGGQMASKMFRFLQRDINEGRIWYEHNGGLAKSDFFRFQVSDEDSPKDILHDQEMYIVVLQPLLGEQFAARGNSQEAFVDGGDVPYLDSLTALNLVVLENQLGTITRDSLTFRDSNTEDADIIYHISRPIAHEDGTLEHIDHPHVPVTEFTQEDINENNIVYRPPAGELGQLSKTVHFYFTVEDNRDGHQLPEQQFTIQLMPVNDSPPELTVPSPLVMTSQGGTVLIGPAVIAVTDADTRVEDLIFSLIEVPSSGQFMKKSDAYEVVLRKGDQFTMAEVKANEFYYQHDAAGHLNDLIQLSVSDGAHTQEINIEVKVIHTDKSAPLQHPDALMVMTIEEDSTRVIERQQLAFVDVETPDSNLKITLASKPQFGRLSFVDGHRLRIGSHFTQMDINEEHIRYTSKREVGQLSVSELVYFNVSDSNGNKLPMQLFSVTVLPVNNQAPMVTLGRGIQLSEGHTVILSAKHIDISDADSPTEDLTVFVESAPMFGILENTQAESAMNEQLSSFPVQDLLHGYIVYHQMDHINKEPTADGFLFYVTDGLNQSPTYKFNISIELVNDEQPSLVSEQILCQEEQGVVINNGSVFVTDIDTPADQLIFTLIRVPTRGKIRRKLYALDTFFSATPLSAGSTFSYQDVLRGFIVYTHDGEDDVDRDSFDVSLTDGEFIVNSSIEVVIGLISEEIPRMAVNRGLRVKSGSVTVITSNELRATDIDSEDDLLTYTVKARLPFGVLVKNDEDIFMTNPIFTQSDINNGNIKFAHLSDEESGTCAVDFDVSDRQGNTLIAQTFMITVLDDRMPPKIVANNELQVKEGSSQKITTAYLSATDVDTDPARLQYTLKEMPVLGHLAFSHDPETSITAFTQAELAADIVEYVHTSDEELYLDTFVFSVSDGKNQAVQKFYLTILPVDDSLPVLTNNGLKVQEGMRKLITEFELKATDADTKEDHVQFQLVQLPRHGVVELGGLGGDHVAVSSFTMADIYSNRVTYRHDGSDSHDDSFMFSITDSTNSVFRVQETASEHTESQPQVFSIQVIPVDDGSPILNVNVGLQHLELVRGQPMNFITKGVLHATDVDTTPDLITYQVTKPPLQGQLEKVNMPGDAVTFFTQEEVNNGEVKYVLTRNMSATTDSFCFDLMDSKPNIVKGNVFHIVWSFVKFGQVSFNVSETAGFIQIPLMRYGNLKQYSIVTCSTRPGTATFRPHKTRPGRRDFTTHRGQVQFDEWQQMKFCTVVINDDSIFEGVEHFYVTLSQPSYTLIGQPDRATVNIIDDEDEPVLMFESGVYAVNESCGFLHATVVRSGDTSVTASAICYTHSLTAQGSSTTGLESGSDYQTRPADNNNRIVFEPGVTKADCIVRIIDDSLDETMEQFEIGLMEPSMLAKIGPISKTLAIIDGPNDESLLHLSANVYLVDEDRGHINIPVLRHGTDLSHTSIVWCASRMTEPPSAIPGHDYVPNSHKITFRPGQRHAICSVQILDDVAEPRLEGNETFIVFLSSSIGSHLSEPHSALVVINDTNLDIPVMQFERSAYTIDEMTRQLSVPVMRTGDISFTSSVICYTRQDSATVGRDFEERVLMEESRITLRPGEMSKNCSVMIVNDDEYEEDETFHLKLARPQGTERCRAEIGALNSTTITITNTEDAPRVQLEMAAYSVQEPSSPKQFTSVTAHVMRFGDARNTIKVRCSTRDGSAIAGSDYRAKSELLTFNPGVHRLEFVVEILHNKAAEWHESFFIALTLEGHGSECVIGTPAVATVTILDCQVSATLVLPTPPMVVSLRDYDNIQKQESPRSPSPGYPIVCVTPCDLHHPSYDITGALCDQAGVDPSTIQFRWEVSLPEADSSSPPSTFEPLTDTTPFTSVTEAVLDSMHFGPRLRVRCSAQPLHRDGSLGVPLRSPAIDIASADSDLAICRAPPGVGGGGLHAQSFVASLEYVGPSADAHANMLHMHVRVPHHDGMLPLVSTLPIHNIRLLLSETAYRRQHTCSNFVMPSEQQEENRYSILTDDQPDPSGPGFQLPYQLSREMRGISSVRLYRHLDLNSCTWHFDAWYPMAEMVSACGGTVISDFEARDIAHSYLTVRVPLYVSYVYALAPSGWSAAEHRTELQLSFYYNTMHWKAGLQTGDGDAGEEMSASLQLLRLGVGKDGNLLMDFKTRTNFRGQFVLSHKTLPDVTSRVIAPTNLPLTFELSLVWGQQTYDAPSQIWRATSDFNLKDYSGDYTIELIPCTVSASEVYAEPLKCTAKPPQSFVLPITFQQTIRPVPLVYSLDTSFELTSSKDVFLSPPVEQSGFDEATAFSPDETLYGRVLWNRAQDLQSAYKLHIEKLYICTGTDGHIPFYDPTGEVYHEGPQYGCLQPGGKVKDRFLILDYVDPDVTDRTFHDVPFEAHFASEKVEYAAIENMPGVDGFSFKVAPLFQTSSGQQWYLQVIYSIGPADKILERHGRSVAHRRTRRSSLVALADARNGTNIHALTLNDTAFVLMSHRPLPAVKVILPLSVGAVVFVLLLCCLCCCCVVRRRRKRHRDKPSQYIYKDLRKSTPSTAQQRQRPQVEMVSYKPGKRAPTTTVKSKIAHGKVPRHKRDRPKSGTEV